MIINKVTYKIKSSYNIFSLKCRLLDTNPNAILR